jgi:hypothetical protein
MGTRISMLRFQIAIERTHVLFFSVFAKMIMSACACARIYMYTEHAYTFTHTYLYINTCARQHAHKRAEESEHVRAYASVDDIYVWMHLSVGIDLRSVAWWRSNGVRTILKYA